MKKIEFGHNWVRIEDNGIFGIGAAPAKRLFALRVFALPEVTAVVIEPESGFALVRYRSEPEQQRDFRARLINAVGGEHGELDGHKLPVWPMNEKVVLHCWNGNISSMEIKQQSRYRLTLHHPLFKKDEKKTAHRVKRALDSVPGVAAVSISRLNGNIHVRYSAAVEPITLVRKAEAQLLLSDRLHHPLPQHQGVSFSAANVNMLLCTAGQFMFPAMIPLASGVLVVSRYEQIKEAAGGLIRGKVNVPAFQSLVVACSVATGAPLASALGEWLSCYWQRSWRKKVAVETRQLLDDALPMAGQAVLLDDNGTERLVPVSGLNPGDRIKVGVSGLIPVDGSVVSGEALVNEAVIRGISGVKRKRPSDHVYNSSVVTSGSLVIEVRSTLAQTESSKLANSILGMTTQLPSDRELKRRELALAQRSVLPNLALAGLGVATGGLHTASAILHQDWISGPLITLPMQSFQGMRESLQYGALINSATALPRLAEVDVLVLDGDCDALLAPRMELKSVHTDLKDTDALLALCASVAMCLGDERAEALIRVCSERGLMLRGLDSVVLEPGCTQAVIDGHSLSLLDQDNSPNQSNHSLLLHLDGVAIARLAFGYSVTPRAAETIAALKGLGLRVVVISSQSNAAAQDYAQRLGADLSSGGMGSAERVRFLRRLKELGHKPAYLGKRNTVQELVSEAHVSVAIGGVFEESGTVDIFILSELMDPLIRLLELARQQKSQTRAVCRKAVLPNLLCITGAFGGVLNGTTSTLLANVGVSNIDRHHHNMLSRPPVSRETTGIQQQRIAADSYLKRLLESAIDSQVAESSWIPVYAIDME